MPEKKYFPLVRMVSSVIRKNNRLIKNGINNEVIPELLCGKKKWKNNNLIKKLAPTPVALIAAVPDVRCHLERFSFCERYSLR